VIVVLQQVSISLTYIMVRSYISLRWCPLWTWPTRFLIGFSSLKQQSTGRHGTHSYKYLEFDLIKHCHVIFIHSLGQLLIVRSHSKVHRSRGNPKDIPMWASRISNYSYFPWFNRQQTWRPATDSSLQAKKKFYILYRIFTQSRRYSITWCLMQKYSI
jgi:hypothetical protein